jgi:hypothetical protein
MMGTKFVVPGAAQDHRCKDCEGQLAEKVPHQEDRLQAEQAGPGEDVAEAVGRFL